jgi:hypothetical protein
MLALTLKSALRQNWSRFQVAKSVQLTDADPVMALSLVAVEKPLCMFVRWLILNPVRC